MHRRQQTENYFTSLLVTKFLTQDCFQVQNRFLQVIVVLLLLLLLQNREFFFQKLQFQPYVEIAQLKKQNRKNLSLTVFFCSFKLKTFSLFLSRLIYFTCLWEMICSTNLFLNKQTTRCDAIIPLFAHAIWSTSPRGHTARWSIILTFH